MDTGSLATAPNERQAPPHEEASEARWLAFYDRLRRRVEGGLERHGGRLGAQAAQLLLLAPDVFILLVRLTLDRRTPRDTRRLLGGALLYFVVPIDLLPEAFTGVAGYVDDLVLAALVLGEALDPRLEALAERHWSGRGTVRRVLSDVAANARMLLGTDLLARLQRLLERRGVRVDLERQRGEGSV